ncbi:MAG: hypothetical protein JOS17DRAFT_746334 [Linnemannia elongata]|nr:MAG: hypothetical protein JOS17DRAFT_746334 [Linnemannia elongata]
MSVARPHDNDNGHSASVQIDPPAQPAASSTSGTPAPLPAHRRTYNDEDDGSEEGPLLGAGGGGPGRHHGQPVGGDGEDGTGGSGQGQAQRSKKSDPFLYRLHDWLADCGTTNKNATNLLTTTSQPALIVCSLFLCRIEPEKMGKVLEVDPHPPCRSPFYSPPRAFQFDPLRSAPL